jgi:hypothetical protein
VIDLAVVLVLLHAPQGHDIYVNPDTVTTMRAAVPGKANELVSDEVQCLLNTSDGKFISVVETCDQVRTLFRGRHYP